MALVLVLVLPLAATIGPAINFRRHHGRRGRTNLLIPLGAKRHIGDTVERVVIVVAGGGIVSGRCWRGRLLMAVICT